jgi:O-antigen ligase
LFALCGWLIIYLHILAARTGLFSFYIMAAVAVLWLLLAKKNTVKITRVKALSLILALIILPFIAIKLFPSLQNRIAYFKYDSSFFLKGQYNPGTTDAIRIISLKAGWDLMNENPLLGTGFGDIESASNDWDKKNYPQMLEADKILPSSEWLIYGSGCGWLGFIFFSLCMLLPFFSKTKNKMLWWMLNISAAFSFLFDIGLEVQFGVFLYSFLLLMSYTCFNSEKITGKASLPITFV